MKVALNGIRNSSPCITIWFDDTVTSLPSVCGFNYNYSKSSRFNITQYIICGNIKSPFPVMRGLKGIEKGAKMKQNHIILQ